MKLNNIPLEFDARIHDIADVKTVITADEKDVGKMGYFANSIHLFKNLEGLDGIKYGKLMYLSDLNYGGDKSDKCFVCDNKWAYRYFIPEDVLKPVEKKYRPFTPEEFIAEFPIGSKIIYRYIVEDREINIVVITKIETTEDCDFVKVCLGTDFPLELKYMFEHLEIKINGEWQPFGVLDKGEE